MNGYFISIVGKQLQRTTRSAHRPDCAQLARCVNIAEVPDHLVRYLVPCGKCSPQAWEQPDKAPWQLGEWYRSEQAALDAQDGAA